MNDMKLVETKNCPVCESLLRERSQDMAVGRGEDLQGRYYLKPAAAALGMSLEELTKRIQTYRCLSCGNYFCDPWFNPQLASLLFGVAAPDHLFAWGNFENWLHRRSPAQDRMQELFDIVIRMIGPITNYAEFGCPFQGLLMQFKGMEAKPFQRIMLFSKALNRQPDVRWSRITWLYNAQARWCGYIAVFSLHFRGVLVKLANLTKTRSIRSIPTSSDVVSNTTLLPTQRFLLTRDTTMGWGSNCVRFGASCRYFAQTILGAKVIPLEEAHRKELPRFDLIGIFNILDHTTFPMDIVRKSLELADHVLVVTHRAALAGKQHLYAFSDEFVSWLNQVFDGASANDLSDLVGKDGKDNIYVIISRKGRSDNAYQR